MGVGEAIANGFFGLLNTALMFLLLVVVVSAMLRHGSRFFGGSWGRPSGTLFPLDPRRLWCRHPVAWHGPGTNGLWAMWCNQCGKRVGERRIGRRR